VFSERIQKVNGLRIGIRVYPKSMFVINSQTISDLVVLEQSTTTSGLRTVRNVE
jgi:hypothetical protein